MATRNISRLGAGLGATTAGAATGAGRRLAVATALAAPDGAASSGGISGDSRRAGDPRGHLDDRSSAVTRHTVGRCAAVGGTHLLPADQRAGRGGTSPGSR